MHCSSVLDSRKREKKYTVEEREKRKSFTKDNYNRAEQDIFNTNR